MRCPKKKKGPNNQKPKEKTDTVNKFTHDSHIDTSRQRPLNKH